MKTDLRFSPVLVWLFLMFGFAGCIIDPIEPSHPTHTGLTPIEYTPEVQEPITNDFTLLKACIGKTQSEATALLTNHGFSHTEGNKFVKTENGITKEAEIYAPGNVAMTLRDSAFDVLKLRFHAMDARDTEFGGVHQTGQILLLAQYRLGQRVSTLQHS